MATVLAPRRHRYHLAVSPGRIPTTAGAICLTAAILAAALLGRAPALLAGFGTLPLLEPLGHGSAAAAAAALLLGYPALFATSLLAEASASGRVFAWLGHRVRGSLGLLWTTLLAALLVLHVAHGHPWPLLLGCVAALFTAGGVLGRALDRQPDPAFKPLARAMPALLMSLASTSLAATLALRGGIAPLADLDGLLGSAVLVGTLLLLVGGTRDVHHQLRQGPRRMFCRDALRRELTTL